MKKCLLSILLLLLMLKSYQQSFEGNWYTFDKKGNKESMVNLYIAEDGLLYGKVAKLYDTKTGEEIASKICKKCDGEYKNADLVGLPILRGLSYNKEENFYHGKKKCYTPDLNMLVDVKVRLDEKNQDILYIRGSIAFISETRSWQRVVPE